MWMGLIDGGLELGLDEAEVEVGVEIVGIKLKSGLVGLDGLGPRLDALGILAELFAEPIECVAEVVVGALLELEVGCGRHLGKVACGGGEVTAPVGGCAAVVLEARVGAALFKQPVVGGLGFIERAGLELFEGTGW